MFPNKLHVFVARFAVALGFVTSCYVNTCYAILCYFQIDILFSCLQQSMMDDSDDETFPSITVTVRKSLGYQITFVQSRQPLRIGLLVTNETPASSQFLIFFVPVTLCNKTQLKAIYFLLDLQTTAAWVSQHPRADGGIISSPSITVFIRLNAADAEAKLPINAALE